MVTVVRGSGDDAARSRLRSGYDTGDAELLATFDRLAEGRLKVFAGLLLPSRGSPHARHCGRLYSKSQGLRRSAPAHTRHYVCLPCMQCCRNTYDC